MNWGQLDRFVVLHIFHSLLTSETMYFMKVNALVLILDFIKMSANDRTAISSLLDGK